MGYNVDIPRFFTIALLRNIFLKLLDYLPTQSVEPFLILACVRLSPAPVVFLRLLLPLLVYKYYRLKIQNDHKSKCAYSTNLMRYNLEYILNKKYLNL